MMHRTAIWVALTVAAGCTDTTCPASVRSVPPNFGIDLAIATGAEPPTTATEMVFAGRDGDVLSFEDGTHDFTVTTQYAEWAQLTPGQRVTVRNDYGRPVYGSVAGTGVSLYVTDPESDALIFAVLAQNGFFHSSPRRLTFADIAIDFEIDCTARASDCQPPPPGADRGSEPVDGEHLVAHTTVGTTHVERGETREVDGFRIFLRDAWRLQPQLTTVECDHGTPPRREAVIARIE